MEQYIEHKNNIALHGFTVVEGVFTPAEMDAIADQVQRSLAAAPGKEKTSTIFAIRQFLQFVPASMEMVFREKFTGIIRQLFGDHCFVVKSIYFDKPPESNWFVAFHQDLTIAVNKRADLEGFSNWTIKQAQYAVQPPVEILQQNFTIRIHLDDTDEQNGALKIIPGSHLKGIYRPETIDWSVEREISTPVKKGGIIIMRPLVMHASGKTTNGRQRRVIHIEFSKTSLPAPLRWAEIQHFQ